MNGTGAFRNSFTNRNASPPKKTNKLQNQFNAYNSNKADYANNNIIHIQN